ncbi:MAG: glycosyltransferase family 2 protein [Elusimicrobiota bacterium]|jgi:dolichol-phosphate mannosyltransferase
MEKLSVVVPAYNEQEVLPEFHRRLSAALEGLGLEAEILFVDDGSRDATAAVLAGLRERDPRVRVLRFSRNFGHQIAITAGLDHAVGDAAVVIDADLQDPPETLRDMVARWREGFDVVYAVRSQRESESFFKRATAGLFYRLLRSMTDVDLPVDAGDFRLLSRRAYKELNAMRERHRYVRGLASWLGFRQGSVTYRREARFAGETKYPLHKMLRFALDAIVSFSEKPLRLATYLGFSASLVSLLSIVYFLVYKLFPDFVGFPPLPPGTTAAIVAIFFLGGVQLICLGIIGEYLGRLYEESKRRPLYVLDDSEPRPEPR